MRTRRITENIIILLFIFGLTFITSLSLNSNPFSEFLPAHDSSMFTYFGYAMSRGKMMYTEIFDHKGPMIFLINYLGVILSTEYITGIYILEFISLFVYFYFSFRIITFWLKPYLSLITLLPQALLLTVLLEGGNLTEEFALPFIAISLYYVTKYYKNEHYLFKWELIALGICGGIVFSLRANMIILWLVFGISIFIEKIIAKDFNNLKIFVSYFLGGLIATFVLLGVYLYMNGALEAAIFQSLIFNFMYLDSTKSNGDAVRILYKILSEYYVVLLATLFFVYVPMTWRDKNKKDKMFEIGMIIFIIGSFYTSIISGRAYAHYLMAILPTLTVPIAILLNKAFHNKQQWKSIVITFLAFLLIYYSQIYTSYERIYIKNIETIQEDTKYEKLNKSIISNYNSKEYTNDIASIIKDNTEVDDQVYVHRIDGSFYLLSERLSSIKYFNLPAVNLEENKLIGEDFLSDIKSSSTKLILVKKSYYDNSNSSIDQKFISYINDNFYSIYEDSNYYIFKKKETN